MDTITIIDKNKEEIDNIAEIIANTIIDNYEISMVNKTLNSLGLENLDEDAYSFIVNCLNSTDETSEFGRVARVKELKKNILQYFKTQDTLIVEGFVNFRMRDYTNYLENLLDEVIYEYNRNQKNNKFLKDLKTIVKANNSMEQEIHLRVNENMDYEMVNDKQENINDKYKIQAEMSSNSTTEDLILSVLIKLVPEKLYLHDADRLKSNFVNTIKEVFAEKVQMC